MVWKIRRRFRSRMVLVQIELIGQRKTRRINLLIYWCIIFSWYYQDLGLGYRWIIIPDIVHPIFDFIWFDLPWLSFYWIGLIFFDGFLSFKYLSGEFGSTKEDNISFGHLVFFTGFLRSLISLTKTSLLMSSFKKPATTYHRQSGLNLSIKNWQQWNNSDFLVKISSPIALLKYWSNTMSRKLPTKVTSGVNFIYPNLRDWVVGK